MFVVWVMAMGHLLDPDRDEYEVIALTGCVDAFTDDRKIHEVIQIGKPGRCQSSNPFKTWSFARSSRRHAKTHLSRRLYKMPAQEIWQYV